MRCDVHGAACHSAYAPQGVNAIEYAADLIGELGRIGTTLRAMDLHDPRFDPPFTTVQTGMISGGKALNIVPADCRFDFEVRALPAQDPRDVAEQLQQYAETHVLPKMRAVHAGSDIRFCELSAYPGLVTDAKSQAAQLIAQFCGSDEFTTVAFGTEGGLFDAIGIPTVVCGPGSMDQGHKPDEFVSVEQLDGCDAMLRRMVDILQSTQSL
jgi:acetylornithine deacetylase